MGGTPHDIDDITFEGPDGSSVEAFLVRPAWFAGNGDRVTGPAVLAWHWLDDRAPDGDRTQFLEEAAGWAGLGITSLLPQGRFPWKQPPVGAEHDRAAIVAEVGRVQAGLDRLVEEPGVDPSRLAVVGHDFGGMLAIVAAAREDRLRGLVVVAATPRWGDWLLPFWQIDEDRIDYLRALRPLDPIECIRELHDIEILFQFGSRDFYIAPMSAWELERATADGSTSLTYDAEHDMRLAEIRADRLEFLVRVLGIPRP